MPGNKVTELEEWSPLQPASVSVTIEDALVQRQFAWLLQQAFSGTCWVGKKGPSGHIAAPRRQKTFDSP